MDSNKFQIILDSLLKRTESDQLNWKTTASSTNFLLVLNDSSISINNESSLTTGLIIFEFRNERGEIVEEVDLYENQDDYNKAEKLYDLARRKALRSDETIDRIIEQLKPDSLAA